MALYGRVPDGSDSGGDGGGGCRPHVVNQASVAEGATELRALLLTAAAAAAAAAE